MHGEIEVGVDSGDVDSMTSEHDAIATGFVRTHEQPTLVGSGPMPTSSHDHSTCLRPLSGDDPERVDEVLVAFQPACCPEEAFWGVHVSDEANQRHTGRQPELAPENSSLPAPEVVHIRAVVREKDPCVRDTTTAILLAGPPATADPHVVRPACRQIETTKSCVLQVERSGHLEDARHGVIAAKR